MGYPPTAESDETVAPFTIAFKFQPTEAEGVEAAKGEKVFMRFKSRDTKCSTSVCSSSSGPKSNWGRHQWRRGRPIWARCSVSSNSMRRAFRSASGPKSSRRESARPCPARQRWPPRRGGSVWRGRRWRCRRVASTPRWRRAGGGRCRRARAPPRPGRASHRASPRPPPYDTPTPHPAPN